MKSLSKNEYEATLAMLGWRRKKETRNSWVGKDCDNRESYVHLIDSRLVIQKRETVYLSFEQSIHLLTTGTYIPYEDYNQKVVKYG